MKISLSKAITATLTMVTISLSSAAVEAQPTATTATYALGSKIDVAASTATLDNLMTTTVGQVRPQALSKHTSFADYWHSARPAREGKAFEAITTNMVNSRNAATHGTTRWVTSASLGSPHHPADILELDGSGKIVRRIQAKLGFGGTLASLSDAKYEGMGILTDQDTYDALRSKLNKQLARSSKLGKPLSVEYRALQEAIEDGRLLARLPSGAPLPTRTFVSKAAEEHAHRLWNRHADDIARVGDDALRKASSSADDAAVAVRPQAKATSVMDEAAGVLKHADDVGSTALRVAGKVTRTVTRAAPWAALGFEVYQRGSEAASTERQFTDGTISLKQREVQHAGSAGRAVGGVAGAAGGALAGVELGGAAGSFAGPPGSAVGAVLGGIGGAVGGALGGEALLGRAAEFAVEKVHAAGRTVSGTAVGAWNWAARKSRATWNWAWGY